MNVRELMNPTSDYIDVAATVTEAAILMRDSGASSLVVMDDGAVAGIITESDIILDCVADNHLPWQCRVERHMTQQNRVVSPDTHMGDASLIMIDSEFDFIPVMSGGQLTGLLTANSIFEAIDMEMALSTV